MAALVRRGQPLGRQKATMQPLASVGEEGQRRRRVAARLSTTGSHDRRRHARLLAHVRRRGRAERKHRRAWALRERPGRDVHRVRTDAACVAEAAVGVTRSGAADDGGLRSGHASEPDRRDCRRRDTASVAAGVPGRHGPLRDRARACFAEVAAVSRWPESCRSPARSRR
jgi:hypothetical protein